MTLEITPFTPPAALDGPGAEDFAAMLEVRNASQRAMLGSDDDDLTVEELLVGWRPDPRVPQPLWLARVDGEVVGRGFLEWDVEQPEDKPFTIGVFAQVHPDHAGRGYGTRIARVLEEAAIAEGAQKLVAWAEFAEPAAPDTEWLPAPTGFGRVPRDAPGTRLALRLGYSLEQVERTSRLELPVAGLDRFRAEAAAAAGSDYRLHFWSGVTPAEWLEGVAVLRTRMSTDAPSAGLDLSEERWDADRVVEYDERRIRDSPFATLTVAAEHVPTGALAGYSFLEVPREPERTVRQGDTLVLREHRGRRLGMLLKAANLGYLERELPGRRAVTTTNAEENRHMLDVNETLGFRPVAYEGAWMKLI